MEPNDTLRAQARNAQEQYQRSGQTYADPYARGTVPPGDMYDDDFVEALAGRMAKLIAESPEMKAKSAAATPAQRLTLAIFSLIAFIALSGIVFGVASSSGQMQMAVIAIFFISIAICIVNIVFNVGHR